MRACQFRSTPLARPLTCTRSPDLDEREGLHRAQATREGKRRVAEMKQDLYVPADLFYPKLVTNALDKEAPCTGLICALVLQSKPGKAGRKNVD